MSSLTLTVNGRRHTVDAPPNMPLLWVLRDTLGLTGTKFGCGVAQCGACTVHVDGKPIRSCVTPISAVTGKAVTTIEGLSGGEGGVEYAAADRAGPWDCHPSLLQRCRRGRGGRGLRRTRWLRARAPGGVRGGLRNGD